MATMDTEIRKLQPGELCKLAQFLNQSDIWKKFMAMIPNEDENATCMFTNDHIAMTDQAIRQQQRSGADIFLSEWSTCGKNRPTCRTLLDLLVKAKLFRAADYLVVDVLKGDPPVRPQTGPAAAIEIPTAVLEDILKQSELAEVKRDLMKYSAAGEISLGKLPKQMSGLMKFSVKATENNQPCQEAHSEDIPLCVRRAGAFDELRNAVVSVSPELEAQRGVIPVVVLAYNEKPDL